MTQSPNRLAAVVAVCGFAAGLASTALAQQTPYVINLSGATLQETFLSSPAQCNDYIDANADGYSRFTNPAPASIQRLNLSNNLAFVNPYPAIPALPDRTRLHWITQYRGVGSVNGLQELINFGRTDILGTNLSSYVTTNAIDFNALNSRAADRGYANADGNTTGERYCTGGSGNGRADFNPGNPGGAPVRSAMDGSYLASPYTGDYVSCGDNVPADTATSANDPIPPFHCPGAGGIQIDIAPLDIPSHWGVQIPGGTPGYLVRPGTAGYGRGHRFAVKKDGTPFTSIFTGAQFDSALAALGSRNLYTEPGTGNPPNFADVNTLFDTKSAFVPVAPITNYGTGYQQITFAQLRHLFVTGRMPSGENLMAVTRDTGSGTHGAFMNAIGLDPSFAVGENIGGSFTGQSSLAAENNLGSAFVPGNKSGSGGLESTVFGHRLAVGYTGAERGINSAWLPGKAEILAVQKDGTRADSLPGDFVRPTISQVLNNGLRGQIDPSTGTAYTVDGWQINGPASYVTLGRPRNAPANKGGWGWQSATTGETGPNPEAALPAMSNVEASAWVNNISRSLDSINAGILTPALDGTPGEYLAATFILYSAPDFSPNLTDPASYILNPDRVQSVQNFTPGLNALSNSAYNTFNTAQAGLAPVRNGITGLNPYNDGVVNGTNYIDQTGQPVSYGADLDAIPALVTNKIAGDFDGNGVRNTADVTQMLAAYKSRNVGPNTWRNTDRVVIEIIGDFNGDGKFDKEDVRYWSDGLHLIAGNLDRKAGFIAVDNASVAASMPLNFFNTTLATGKAYTAGDARGDVCGPSQLTTRGFAPTANGLIDANDIDYVYKQIRSGSVAWSNLTQSQNADLSADMNGDLAINQCDVDELVVTILGTNYGDVNLNGQVQLSDINTIQANLGTNGGWAQGDMNGDGVINALDRSIARCHAVMPGVTVACPPGNLAGPTPTTPAGVASFVSIWFASLTAADTKGDFDGNGSVNPADVAAFVGLWFDVVQNGC